MYTTFSLSLQIFLDLITELVPPLFILEVTRGFSASMKTIITALFHYALCTHLSPSKIWGPKAQDPYLYPLKCLEERLKESICWLNYKKQLKVFLILENKLKKQTSKLQKQLMHLVLFLRCSLEVKNLGVYFRYYMPLIFEGQLCCYFWSFSSKAYM